MKIVKCSKEKINMLINSGKELERKDLRCSLNYVLHENFADCSADYDNMIYDITNIYKPGIVLNIQDTHGNRGAIDSIIFSNYVITGVKGKYLGGIGTGSISCLYVTDFKEQCIVHMEDGVIAKSKFGNVRKFITDKIISEINDVRNVVYNEDDYEIITEHFKGTLEVISEKYVRARFTMFIDDTLAWNNCNELDEGLYTMIIDRRTKQVVGDRAYLNVIKLDNDRNNLLGTYDNMVIAAYRKKIARCREERLVHRLIDLNNGTIILEDVLIRVLDGHYILTTKNQGTINEEMTVYRFNKYTGKLEKVIPAQKNVWVREVNIGEDRNRFFYMYKKTKGTGIYGNGKFEKVARIKLNDSENICRKAGKNLRNILEQQSNVEIYSTDDDYIIR